MSAATKEIVQISLVVAVAVVALVLFVFGMSQSINSSKAEYAMDECLNASGVVSTVDGKLSCSYVKTVVK